MLWFAVLCVVPYQRRNCRDGRKVPPDWFSGQAARRQTMRVAHTLPQSHHLVAVESRAFLPPDWRLYGAAMKKNPATVDDSRLHPERAFANCLASVFCAYMCIWFSATQGNRKPRCTSSSDSNAIAELLARKSGPVHFTGHASLKSHDLGLLRCSSLSLMSMSFRTISPCATS